MDHMMQVDESLTEVHKPISLCTPKNNFYDRKLECEIHVHHRKTAQIDQEMDRYSIDILGLSEVRWPMNEKITLQSGKAMLYKEGVGIIPSSRAKTSLISMQDFFTTTLKISVVVVYSPANESAEKAKEAFLEQLQDVINNIPKHDVLLIINFNAKVGSNNEGHESAMGKHGIHKGEK
jgi:hypothetical protein